MDNLDHIEVTHKCFEIMNALKEKYSWDIMIKNSADTMGIEVNLLEKIVTEIDMYKWNNDTGLYELKD